MGPMAEGFHDVFDLGDDDSTIATVDADGVAFAAIQGLSQHLDKKDERIAALEAETEREDERLDELEQEVTRKADRIDDSFP